MITQKELDRINELAAKARTEEGLTPGETEERAALRKQYIESMRASLRGQLDSTVVVYPDGKRKKLSEFKK